MPEPRTGAPPLLGIDHVQITVPRGAEEAVRRFYCGLLGLQEIAKPEALRGRGGLWLSAGGLPVHVGAEDGVDRLASKAHVAYRVRDLPAWRERLGAAGIEILEAVPIPGCRRFELRDPFGNRVELVETDAG